MCIPQYVALCGVTLVIGWLVQWVYKWINRVCNGVLPPGSMGFPVIGETLDFFKASPSLDTRDFYKLRMKRYGPIFKTSLLGQRVVISTDAAMNRFIIQQEDTLFRIWFPRALAKIFGEKSLEAFHGKTHKFIRRCAHTLLGVQTLKDVLLPEMEAAVRERLAAWATKLSVDVRGGAPDLLFELVARKCLGFDSTKSGQLRNTFDVLFTELLSFPIYFPGTSFYRCMQKEEMKKVTNSQVVDYFIARRNKTHERLPNLVVRQCMLEFGNTRHTFQARKIVQKTVRDTLAERLSTPANKHGALLDIIVEELRVEETSLSENLAVDVVSALLFGSVFTLSGVIAVTFKSLHDNPDVVHALEKENRAMLNDRKVGCSGLTWEEYKPLTFTNQVTNEIIRISNAVLGAFRRTLADAQVNGYTIPAGWLVIVNPMAAHMNEEFFEDPLKFNPWRWMDESKRSTMMKNFLPFGAGIRVCPAAGFIKVLLTLTLHILVTEYRWEEMKETYAFRSAEVMFPQGYHIRLRPKDKQAS